MIRRATQRLHVSDLRIASRALPIVATVVLAKWAFDAFGWDTIGLNPLYSGLVAANVFLVGFILAGTLADYKESERLPGELAARLDSMADECRVLWIDQQTPAARAAFDHVLATARTIAAWLRGSSTFDATLESIRDFNPHFVAFQPLTQPNFIVRIKQEQATVRAIAVRINAIKTTSFVRAGYVIAEATSGLLIIGLLIAEIDALGAELFLIGAITFLLSYMIMLTKDMDDPFDHDQVGSGGAVEVSLAPLDELIGRLEREVAAR